MTGSERFQRRQNLSADVALMNLKLLRLTLRNLTKMYLPLPDLALSNLTLYVRS